ncbi:peptidoglycan-binding protein [Streptomyces sp. RFCAC02]|uniref:L,D-transpeptidase family protein n=1 Tax=Streptomyces sp. RFCAC02 TaxID=2499143 RepID=UPI00101F6B46|nr:peptidoglycan-binding protein [Streptomyces sp. RFCAC02]
MRSALVRHRRPAVAVAALATAAALLLGGCAADPDGTAADGPSSPGTAEPEATEEPADDAADDGTATPSDEPTDEPSDDPADEIVLAYGDESEQVRELQARLGQLGHFAARPTGFYGDVTLGAVSEYQRAAGLDVSGEVSAATWDTLLGATHDPTDAELNPPVQVMGYGDNSEQVRELQARLGQAGHFDENPTGYYGDVTAAAVRAYQEAAGLDASGTVFEDTWTSLTGATDEPTREELYPPVEIPEPEPGELDERCLEGRVLCISKTSRTLSWVVDGEVRMTVDVRFGAEQTPTREGEFEVYWKSRHHHSTLYDSPMPYAMFFDGGQAVHYSQDFAANGYNGASHGCVNVRDEDAIAALFDAVDEGDKVVVYW